MMQILYTIIASLFVFAALFSAMRAVQRYLRHKNIKAAGAHRMKIAEYVGKFEGDPESSDKLRKFVDAIATYCFSDNWLKGYIASMKKTDDDCGPEDILPSLKAAGKRYEISNPDSLFMLLQTLKELYFVALFTHGNLIQGTFLRLLPEVSEQVDEQLEVVREMLFTGKQINHCNKDRKPRTRKILAHPAHVTLDEGMIKFLDNTSYATAGV